MSHRCVATRLAEHAEQIVRAAGKYPRVPWPRIEIVTPIESYLRRGVHPDTILAGVRLGATRSRHPILTFRYFCGAAGPIAELHTTVSAEPVLPHPPAPVHAESPAVQRPPEPDDPVWTLLRAELIAELTEGVVTSLFCGARLQVCDDTATVELRTRFVHDQVKVHSDVVTRAIRAVHPGVMRVDFAVAPGAAGGAQKQRSITS